jgi:hypothetical protein
VVEKPQPDSSRTHQFLNSLRPVKIRCCCCCCCCWMRVATLYPNGARRRCSMSWEILEHTSFGQRVLTAGAGVTTRCGTLWAITRLHAASRSCIYETDCSIMSSLRPTSCSLSSSSNGNVAHALAVALVVQSSIDEQTPLELVKQPQRCVIDAAAVARC